MSEDNFDIDNLIDAFDSLNTSVTGTLKTMGEFLEGKTGVKLSDDSSDRPQKPPMYVPYGFVDRVKRRGGDLRDDVRFVEVPYEEMLAQNRRMMRDGEYRKNWFKQLEEANRSDNNALG